MEIIENKDLVIGFAGVTYVASVNGRITPISIALLSLYRYEN